MRPARSLHRSGGQEPRCDRHKFDVYSRYSSCCARDEERDVGLLKLQLGPLRATAPYRSTLLA